MVLESVDSDALFGLLQYICGVVRGFDQGAVVTVAVIANLQ